MARDDARPGGGRRPRDRDRRRDLGGADRRLRGRRGARARSSGRSAPAVRRRVAGPVTIFAGLQPGQPRATSRRPTSTRTAATNRRSRIAGTGSRRRSRPRSPASSSARPSSCFGSSSRDRPGGRLAGPARPRGGDRRVGDRERLAVRDRLANRRADLPLRYWRQQAHFTTPAADAAMARKAVEGGTAPVPRMLERLGLTGADLAERLELLDSPRRGATGESDPGAAGDARRRGRHRARGRGRRAGDGRRRRDAHRGRLGIGPAPPACASIRPPGFNLETTVRDLYTLLWRLRERVPSGPLPPRRHRLAQDRASRRGRPARRILLDARRPRSASSPRGSGSAYLVESGLGGRPAAGDRRPVAPSPREPHLRRSRTTAPTSGLPAIGNDHLLADWARAEIVAVAGAVGVPAIDGMTLDYPVADPASMRRRTGPAGWTGCASCTTMRSARASSGMLGKWVGHPAQLFAVLLAYETGLSDVALEHEAVEAGGVRCRRRRGAGSDDDRGRHERSGDGPSCPGRPAAGDRARPVRPGARPGARASSTGPSRRTMLGAPARPAARGGPDERPGPDAAGRAGSSRTSSVGDVYRHAHGRTISETDNTWFTLLTNNTHDIHFNADYASRTEFGQAARREHPHARDRDRPVGRRTSARTPSRTWAGTT